MWNGAFPHIEQYVTERDRDKATYCSIHDNVTIYAQSGIGGDVAAGSVLSGSPAFDAREWLRSAMTFPKLPELVRTLRDLGKKVEQLEKSLPEKTQSNA